MRRSYRSDLTDAQWELIKPLLPPAKPGGRPRTVDLREGGKKVKGRKRHIVVDTMGLLLAVAVTAANLDDGTHAPCVLRKLVAAKYPRLKVAFADNKYNNRALDRWLLTSQAPYRVEVVSK